jgi:hypothetical protein
MAAREALSQLEADLRRIFGSRLRSLVTYGSIAQADGNAPTQTLAVVGELTPEDLHACALNVARWHSSNLGTPLLLGANEIGRSLDAFPIEFATILASYTVVAGDDPFATCHLDPAHLRVACELQARSHLLHLREELLETEGRGSALAVLIQASAPGLAALLTNIARLDGAPAPGSLEAAHHVEGVLGLADDAFSRVVALIKGRALSTEDARRLWKGYVEGMERLVRHVDTWTPRT